MRRQIVGLHQTAADVPEGIYMLVVRRASYRWHPQKPFYSLRFEILQPEDLAGRTFPGRLYCSPRALWKLAWFLRDFGYDPDLLDQDQLDEEALVGLSGVARITYTAINGRSFLNLDAFAPANRWEEWSTAALATQKGQEEFRDL